MPDLIEPIYQYVVAVVYSVNDNIITYRGGFSGRSVEECLKNGRNFVTKYKRPSFIISADVQLPST